MGLLAGIALSLFTGGDIYIWLSDTPAPLAGIYRYFSNPVFWDVFHAATIAAFFIALALVYISASKLYMPALAYN